MAIALSSSTFFPRKPPPPLRFDHRTLAITAVFLPCPSPFIQPPQTPQFRLSDLYIRLCTFYWVRRASSREGTALDLGVEVIYLASARGFEFSPALFGYHSSLFFVSFLLRFLTSLTSIPFFRSAALSFVCEFCFRTCAPYGLVSWRETCVRISLDADESC